MGSLFDYSPNQRRRPATQPKPKIVEFGGVTSPYSNVNSPMPTNTQNTNNKLFVTDINESKYNPTMYNGSYSTHNFGDFNTTQDMINDVPNKTGWQPGQVSDWELYDPNKYGARTKGAFFDSLSLTQGMAHGSDTTMDKIQQTQLSTQQAMQGADAQAQAQQLAQSNLSDEQKAVMGAIQGRQQEAERSALLGTLATQRAERQRNAVSMLTDAALKGRTMQQQEELMALQDQWKLADAQLKEKQLDTSDAYKAIELSMGLDKMQLEKDIAEMGDAQFKAKYDMSKHELNEKIKQAKAEFGVTYEKLAQAKKDLDIRIEEKKWKLFTEELSYLDLNTPEGIDAANALLEDTFPDGKGKIFSTGVDFDDLTLSQNVGKASTYKANIGTFLSTQSLDTYVDDDGNFSFFDNNGKFKSPEMTTNAINAFFYDMGGSFIDEDTGKVYKDPSELIDDWNSGKLSKSGQEAIQNYVNNSMDDFITPQETTAYKNTVATIDMWVANGTITQEEGDKLKTAAGWLATKSVTGGLSYDNETGEVIDITGNPITTGGKDLTVTNEVSGAKDSNGNVVDAVGVIETAKPGETVTLIVNGEETTGKVLEGNRVDVNGTVYLSKNGELYKESENIPDNYVESSNDLFGYDLTRKNNDGVTLGDWLKNAKPGDKWSSGTYKGKTTFTMGEDGKIKKSGYKQSGEAYYRNGKIYVPKSDKPVFDVYKSTVDELISMGDISGNDVNSWLDNNMDGLSVEDINKLYKDKDFKSAVDGRIQSLEMSTETKGKGLFNGVRYTVVNLPFNEGDFFNYDGKIYKAVDITDIDAEDVDGHKKDTGKKITFLDENGNRYTITALPDGTWSSVTPVK